MTIVMPNIDLSLLYPQFVLGAAALLILLLGLFIPKNRQEILSICGLATLNITILSMMAIQGKLGTSTLNNMVTFDGFSLLFSLLFVISSALVFVLSAPFVSKENIPGGEYYSLMLFATLGMVIMASTTDLVIMFLGLELMSIPLYVLSSIARSDKNAAESGMKYLLMGAFSSAFLLYGIAFLYGCTGSTNLKDIGAWLTTHPAGYNDWMVPAGVGLFLIGMGFKVGLVPFHAWIPDVYEGAPTVVTAFMTVGPKAAAFAALCRFFLGGAFNPASEFGAIHWPALLGVLAALTMLMGNLVAVAQTNIKRMLAYSSIAHAGYMLVGLNSAKPEAMASIYFYLVGYMLMNLGAFAIVYMLQGADKKGLQIKRYTGLGYRKPVLALTMSVFLLSLTGFPLTVGFIGKLYLFKDAIAAGNIGLVTLALLTSVVSAFYYLRVVVYMFMREDVSEDQHPLPVIPSLGTLMVSICLAGVLYLGLFPSNILNAVLKLIKL